ncbi:MAG: phytanoyl-CoA dioxygenase family protein [Rhodospirillaceae bacterium]|jgi:non-haem Fe2+, alpha-ketoglutarate-dependent halogenase|nr:phytanoyl-CoA dioxygenase family protein [Rhodospirillaceae bacterium]MBT4590068.1 phytanoyl-CoA dioxygenase family protein [Rhodospirillaceae bacterium]MBT4937648.1 phytanoyl-CoA dioxygenase family protein [Rhodospirillaceae bacterium]MBT7268555.1 phytanoyl-CoA dioxygenase family protein [Rhodospirillaceae bacterium]
MDKVLTAEQVNGYEEKGFLFPFPLYSSDEISALFQKYTALEDKIGDSPMDKFRIKAQLPFLWLCDVVREAKLLDAVEDLIGPDILCWGASFFSKKARDPGYVSWHTDSFFYGFEPADTLTAWLAFNPSDLESGCVRYIPGSHKGPPAVHELKPHENNLIPVGQTVPNVDESQAEYAVLKAGEIVFHHESVVHGSLPNNADHPRIGLAIHYVAPHVRETRFEGSTAMLLRGEDKFGYWGIDPEPQEDMDPVCIKAMEDMRALYLNATRDKAAAGGRS